jgi:hypothetical protein
MLGMQFVNDQFYELTGARRNAVHQVEFLELVADEHAKSVEEDWASVLGGQRSDGAQYRLKKTWVNQDGVRSNIWVQSSSYPQIDEKGNVNSTLHPVYLRRIS